MPSSGMSSHLHSSSTARACAASRGSAAQLPSHTALPACTQQDSTIPGLQPKQHARLLAPATQDCSPNSMPGCLLQPPLSGSGLGAESAFCHQGPAAAGQEHAATPAAGLPSARLGRHNAVCGAVALVVVLALALGGCALLALVGDGRDRAHKMLVRYQALDEAQGQVDQDQLARVQRQLQDVHEPCRRVPGFLSRGRGTMMTSSSAVRLHTHAVPAPLARTHERSESLAQQQQRRQAQPQAPGGRTVGGLRVEPLVLLRRSVQRRR